MKFYRVEPEYKKCVTDTTTWKKEIDGETAYLTKCEAYRWGAFLIRVPETDAEIDERLEEKEMTREDVKNFYGEDFDLNELWLPDPTEEWFEMADYQAELLEMWDGCSTDWDLIVSSDVLDEEAKEEMLDHLMVVYDEEYDFGLNEEEWEDIDCVQEIHTTLSIVECDESGTPLEECE